MNFTEEQKQAIFLEGSNIIVSAGAGSGKTAVLTERVKQKLLRGIHVNELLVLTFTNAAAAEMKDRIRKAILSTPEILDEANLIDGAYITTFDSFSLSVVKKYHTKLNVSNNIKITDEVIIDLKKHEILNQIFDEYYLHPTKEFLKLINDFCLKDDTELKEALLNAYKKIELKFDKESYLEKYYENEMNDLKIQSFIDDYTSILLSKQKDLKKLFLDLELYFDGDFVGKMEDNFSKLLNASSYDEFVSGLDYTSIRVPKGSGEEAKRVKQEVFDLAKSIKDFCVYEDINEMKNDYLSTFSNIICMISILKEFDKRIESFKREEEVYNFTDIAGMAIRVVLENEDIRNELRDNFQEILVDEYQDTSDIQEEFISLISKNNVYMVGDIKQSIYRFRNANPSLFKQKYRDYQDPSKGVKIDLLNNFRSRREVLDNINLLFDLFMDEEIGGAEYKVSHRMIFGNKVYEGIGKTNQNNDMDVIVYDSNNLGRLSKDEEEAFIIGNDIIDKINNKYLVFDKDLKSLRPIEYKDFVILLDKSKNFDLYKKIFEYLHIPLNILKDESFKKDEDSLIIRNLFRLLICIKEGRYDLEFRYTFTSISRSFIWGSSDSEIYDCFIDKKFFETELYKKCLGLVSKMDLMSLSEYFNYVMDEFNYLEKVLTVGNVNSFRIRCEYFYNLCRSYEDLGKTIYDFIDILNSIFDGDYDLKFNVNSSSSNSCKIMTIHKSKGLEFPVCYFASFSSKFSTAELKEKILYDNKYGFIIPKIDNYYKDTFLKTVYKNNYLREDISERIRLFYVALTRAKEKMIIVMPKMEETVECSSFVPTYVREKYNSFLSIMKSIYSILMPYMKESEIVGSKDYLKISGDKTELIKGEDNLEVEELSFENSLVDNKHYSKESLHLIDKNEYELLKFGSDVHKILEEIDFNNYDLDNYNVSSFVKKKIISFLNSDFMKDKISYPMYKEYEFIYEDDDLYHGIIDLLIDCGNHYTIVDYKLKNIDDSLYDKQLKGYSDFIKNKTDREVKCYLYSIFDEKYRLID